MHTLLAITKKIFNARSHDFHFIQLSLLFISLHLSIDIYFSINLLINTYIYFG